MTLRDRTEPESELRSRVDYHDHHHQHEVARRRMTRQIFWSTLAGLVSFTGQVGTVTIVVAKQVPVNVMRSRSSKHLVLICSKFQNLVYLEIE